MTWRSGARQGATTSLRARWVRGRLEWTTGRTWQRATLLQITPTGAILGWAERRTPGVLFLQSRGGRLLVVERLPLEAYVAGVVAAEMGRVGLDAPAALEAQAILARTYVLRAQGKYPDAPYDILASTGDQAYRGWVPAMEPFRAAAAATAGLVLRDGRGALADVFYHSTCGGLTERGDAVFGGAGRSYLQSVPDVDSLGRAYCRDSPHFQWERTIGAPDLTRVLRAVTDLRIQDTTASGRAATVVLRAGTRQVVVTGQAIRSSIAPATTPLRSTAFRLTHGDAGGPWVAVGRGWGHGVGMCQYGAVGRARAGASSTAILAAYFPGTTVSP